jgi:hypothetical protein
VNPINEQKGANEQIMFQNPCQLQEANHKEKDGNFEILGSKPRRTLTCNDIMFQNRGTLHFL